jgi:hypothetical protein
MNILLTLDSGMGANLGPNFNLASNSGHTVTPNTATRAELIAGKSISVLPDGATNIFVTSTGTCTNTLVINIAGITTSTTSTSTSTSTTGAPTSTTTSTSTTSTSTSTSTTTLAPIPVTLAYSNVDGPTACYKFTAPIPDTSTYYLQPGETLADGNTLYVDGVYSNIVADGFYSNGVDYWEVNVVASGGVLSNGTPCPQTTTTTTSTSTTSTSTTSTSTSTTSTSTTSTSTSTSTTTAAPTSTSTTSTTTQPGDTTTTTTSTTAAPTSTSTTSTTTVPLPPGDTSTTTTSTTEPPTTTTSTSTTTTTTTAAPQCTYDGLTIVCDSTTTTTTTQPPTTTTSTSTSTSTSTTTFGTTAAPTVDIYIQNVGSLDIPIGSMTINGVAVTWVGSGPDFVLSSGDNGSFTSTQIGTYDVVIAYGGHTPGQRITFIDSAGTPTCQTLNGSIGTFTITNATITAGTTISVEALDGICP